MRCILLAALLPTILAAQDARAIIQRAVELDRRNTEIARNYTYLQREEERRIDSAGKIKSRKIRTFEVIQVDGSPYRRLVARDDQPLPAEEQREEAEKLQKSNEERLKETPSQREKRVAEARKRAEKRREPLKEMLDAFNFKLAGSEKLNGFDTWIVDASPRPGFRAKTQSGAILSKLKARFWVEKKGNQWVKFEAETLGTVTFGGFIVRLGKGSHFFGEQIRINDEVWLPHRWSIDASARILLVKAMRVEYLYTFSDYRKFSAESRVVSTGEK